MASSGGGAYCWWHTNFVRPPARSVARAGNKFRRWKIIDCFPRASPLIWTKTSLSSSLSGGHRFSAATLLPLVRHVCVHNRKITQRRVTYLRKNEIHYHPSCRRIVRLLTKHICVTRFLFPNDKSLSVWPTRAQRQNNFSPSLRSAGGAAKRAVCAGCSSTQGSIRHFHTHGTCLLHQNCWPQPKKRRELLAWY